MATKPRKPTVATKTSAQALNFVRELQQKFERPPGTKAELENLRKHLAGFENEELKSVARRVLIDLMRGPGGTNAAPRAASSPSTAGGGGRNGGTGSKSGKGGKGGKGGSAPPRAAGKRVAASRTVAKAGTRRVTKKP